MKKTKTNKILESILNNVDSSEIIRRLLEEESEKLERENQNKVRSTSKKSKYDYYISVEDAINKYEQ